MVRLVSSVAAISVIALVALAFWGPDGLRKHRVLREELRELRVRNARLARENRQLALKVRGLRHHPDALRAAIRDELGWVAPGELVVLFRSPRGADDGRTH